MKLNVIIRSIFILLFTVAAFNATNAKSFNELSKVRVYESSSYTESKTETRTFNNMKYNISYDISIGSDILGNITSVDIKINSTNLTDIQKEEFFSKYKVMLNKFTTYSSTGKKNLIYPEESCVMGCTSHWSCSSKPTNAGVALCVGDCIEECYF